MEESLHKPLQWLICLLHCNELPLRALIQHLDGKTAGPGQFKGPIGNLLDDCEKQPIVKFVPVKCIITEDGKIFHIFYCDIIEFVSNFAN